MKCKRERHMISGPEGRPKKSRRGVAIPMLVLGLVLGLILIGILAFFFFHYHPRGGKVTTISESTIQKILDINDLSTLDYTYNAISLVKDPDTGAEKYYVAYEGVVTAGINFSKIDVKLDDENKKIAITIPDAEIQTTSINMGTLEFIFKDKKYETETVSQEAYKECIKDIQAKASQEKELLTMAKENALSTIEALIKPWVEQLDQEYTVEIK